MKLEFVESLTLAHPFIKGFEQVAFCISPEEVRQVAQGETSEAIVKRKREDIEGVEGARPVYSTTFYIGLAIEAKQRAWNFKPLEPSILGSLAYTCCVLKLVLRALGNSISRGRRRSSRRW